MATSDYSPWKDPPKWEQLPWPEWPKPRGTGLVMSYPNANNLEAHLVANHKMPAEVVNGVPYKELEGWHRAEHRYLGDKHNKNGAVTFVGILDHSHPGPTPKGKIK